MTMEYGYCTGFSTTPRFQLGTELLGMIRESGFSYVEFPLMRLSSISPEGFSALRRQVEQTGLASPVACNFFPDSVRLVGKSVYCGQIDGYLACVLPRLQKLRVKKIVLGSGPSRTFESCQTRHEACSQFKDILANVILPRTKMYGMVVCLEPFPSADCNLIVSVQEGADFVDAVGDASFRLMVDIHHMLANGEPLASLSSCFSLIEHVHVAGRHRRIPQAKDAFVFAALRQLAELGYRKTLSFETELPASSGELARALNEVRCIMEES